MVNILAAVPDLDATIRTIATSMTEFIGTLEADTTNGRRSDNCAEDVHIRSLGWLALPLALVVLTCVMLAVVEL